MEALARSFLPLSDRRPSVVAATVDGLAPRANDGRCMTEERSGAAPSSKDTVAAVDAVAAEEAAVDLRLAMLSRMEVAESE